MKKTAYQITLTTKEPLRIGAQKDIMSDVDNPVQVERVWQGGDQM